MTPAIRVENLGKSYRLGQMSAHAGYRTLRESLMGFASRPLRSRRGEADREAPDRFWALRDVIFEIKPAEVVGIIGRNGAGKSTLLKILSRITKPTTGRVELRGRVGSLLEVGTGFHPELTGRENIFLNGAILGMRRREIVEKFDEIVAFSEIGKFLDTPVKRYSSGMYVRLAFAVAAHLEPEILIVDEVLAVGDAAFQKKCIGKMQEVSEGGRTVLFVSHTMSAVQAFCKTAIWMQDGQVFMQDDACQVVSEYLSSLSVLSAIPIVDRIDREGSGAIRLTSLVVEGESGGSPRPVHCGESVSIGLEYRCYEKIARPTFLISLYDPSGTLVSHVNTRMSCDFFGEIPSSGTVYCHIRDLPLPPATYRINAAIVDGGSVLDRVEGAGEMVVEAGDFFGTGTLAGGEAGKVLISHEWSFSREEVH